jgi:hypothetical protein
MLNIPVSFTSAVDVFVAHSGPKLSYSKKRLGDEFHITSHSLLFEQGVQVQQINIEKWNGIPIFFKNEIQSQIPYDIFATSFYMLSRYEEALPHIKTIDGYFDPDSSLSGQSNFMELPVVDLWVKEFHLTLSTFFTEIQIENSPKAKKQILIDVQLPFRYKHQSMLMILGDFFQSIWKLNLFIFFEQLIVLLRIKKDPFESFSSWRKLFQKTTIKPKVFFLYSNSSSYESTVSIFNLAYRKIIKSIGDSFSLGLLVSVKSQLEPSMFLNKEKNNFNKLTLRPVTNVRMSLGIQNISKAYTDLVDQEFRSDYSMGYQNRIGFRAGTATPFHFFNLSNEFQLPIKIYPVVASEKGLIKFNAKKVFEKLETLHESLPLSCSTLTFAVSNEFLSFNHEDKNWETGFKDYIK